MIVYPIPDYTQMPNVMQKTGKARKNAKLYVRRKGHYPHNRIKVSQLIRRLAGDRCEWCKQPCPYEQLSVHHIGAPYADGKPGDPNDKHDLRRENLVALCYLCHYRADLPIQQERQQMDRLRQQHHLLNIGTGLVVYQGGVQ